MHPQHSCVQVLCTGGVVILGAALLALWWFCHHKAKHRAAAAYQNKLGPELPPVDEGSSVRASPQLDEASALTNELLSMYSGNLARFSQCQQVCVYISSVHSICCCMLIPVCYAGLEFALSATSMTAQRRQCRRACRFRSSSRYVSTAMMIDRPCSTDVIVLAWGCTMYTWYGRLCTGRHVC